MIEVENSSKLDNGYAKIWLEDGLLRGEYNPREIDLAGAELIIKDRKELANYKPMPALIDGRKVKVVTKEARDRFSSTDGSDLLTAVALIANSSFTRHLGNFFIKITYKNGKVPIRLFTAIEPAKVWLEQYKEKS